MWGTKQCVIQKSDRRPEQTPRTNTQTFYIPSAPLRDDRCMAVEASDQNGHWPGKDRTVLDRGAGQGLGHHIEDQYFSIVRLAHQGQRRLVGEGCSIPCGECFTVEGDRASGDLYPHRFARLEGQANGSIGL